MYRTILTILSLLIFSLTGLAQCMLSYVDLHNQLAGADYLVEGKVSAQHSAFGLDGNIITFNTIDVYREFGNATNSEKLVVVSEGGIVGDVAQVVYPSSRLGLGEVAMLGLSGTGDSMRVDFGFKYDEPSARFSTLNGSIRASVLYEEAEHAKGAAIVHHQIEPWTSGDSRVAPSVTSFSPTVITAGTMEELTITGSGFGTNQGMGRVAFSNADNGGQSFVELQSGPHYLSWSDDEIRVLVPSSVLFQTVVAGSGLLRVASSTGAVTISAQELQIRYAKGEVIFEEEIGQTSLVGVHNEGYELMIGQGLTSVLNGSNIVQKALDKWTCNTGINLRAVEGQQPAEQFDMNQVSVIGMAQPGTLPANVLGKAITTFSGCGTSDGIEWLLQEVDILFNSEVNWYKGEGSTPPGRFDLMTALIHELGHAHLLQHNNNSNSVMYYELAPSSSRRFLDADSDIFGGSTVVDHSVYDATICSSNAMQFFDETDCNHSLINSTDDEIVDALTIAPNPSNGVCWIQGLEIGQQLTVSDITGKVLVSQITSSVREGLNLTHLPAGVYLVSSDSNSPQKLVIH